MLSHPLEGLKVALVKIAHGAHEKKPHRKAALLLYTLRKCKDTVSHVMHVSDANILRRTSMFPIMN